MTTTTLEGNRPGTSFAVTTPANVPDWIPQVISASFYDRLDTPTLTLTGLAARYGDLEGRPGQAVTIATDTTTTPAANLAVDVPATDDALGSGFYTLTIKEGVKSIAWYDRTQIQAGQDVNQVAGSKVGTAMEARVELDLGAALVAGRNTAVDSTFAGGVTAARIRTMKRLIPPRLRRRGLVMVGADDVLDTIFDDPAINTNAGTVSDEARAGALTRPIAGVELMPVDAATLPTNVTVAAGTGNLVVVFALGMLAYAFQKNPSIESERDARARLTRHVGTMLHAEGTLEAAGIVVARVT